MSKEFVVRRIRAICAEQDAMAMGEMQERYREIRMEHSRLRYPSFESIGKVWLLAIQNKQKALQTELPVLLDSAFLDDELLGVVEEELARCLADDVRGNPIQLYRSALEREAGRCGVQVRARSDLADAAYRAASSNANRSARQSIRDTISLYFMKKGTPVTITRLMNDRLSVLKKSGARVDDLKAAISSSVSIIAEARDVLVESGDLLHRRMSNGGEETYEVLDPGFYEQQLGIPAHYQMRVKKLGVPEAAAAVQSITYNLNGAGSRVNNHSTDNSVNISTVSPEVSALVAALRQEIAKLNLEQQVRQDAEELIAAAERNIESPSPSKAVVKATLNALPHAASVASIVSAIVGLL